MFNRQKNPFIWERKKALSPNVCDGLIRLFERANAENKTHEGRVGGVAREAPRVDPTIKKSQDLYIEKDVYKYEDKVLYDNLAKMLKEYVAYIGTSIIKNSDTPIIFTGDPDTVVDTGYQIQRTSPGGFYKWHTDYKVDPKGYARKLTYLWYLNTIKDGGYTEFYNGHKVYPEQGKLLIFPSGWSYYHRGYPPKKDVKYIVIGWILDRM